MEKKFFIGIGIITAILLIGGYLLVSKQDARLSKPLMGQEVTVQGRNHVQLMRNIGNTSISKSYTHL